MKKFKSCFYAFLFILMSALIANAVDLDNADKLYDKGKYKEGLDILEKDFDSSKPDAEMIWRL